MKPIDRHRGDWIILGVYGVLIALLIAVASWTAHQWVSHPGHGRITSDSARHDARQGARP